LVVDCEGGDLLDQLEKVNCGVEEGGLELLVEVGERLFATSVLC
jgi:hypothetical protein